MNHDRTLRPLFLQLSGVAPLLGHFYEWQWGNEWDLEVESAMDSARGLYTVEGYGDPEAVQAVRDDERELGYHNAWVDMLGRYNLGSWLWRENPNPESPDHSWLGWAPAHDYTEAPETLGVMIHPLYLWHPDGEPAGYPAGGADTPWKWWPIAPAYEYPDEHGGLFHISVGGCHRPNEPYLWATSGGGFVSGITTDGGPVWAWPGVVEDAGMLPFLRQISNQRWWDRGQESGNWHETPRTRMQHQVAFGPYHPPVPCQDILDGKYEPDQVALKVDISTYKGWGPAVGDQPHPEWTNPPQSIHPLNTALPGQWPHLILPT